MFISNEFVRSAFSKHSSPNHLSLLELRVVTARVLIVLGCSLSSQIQTIQSCLWPRSHITQCWEPGFYINYTRESENHQLRKPNLTSYQTTTIALYVYAYLCVRCVYVFLLAVGCLHIWGPGNLHTRLTAMLWSQMEWSQFNLLIVVRVFHGNTKPQQQLDIRRPMSRLQRHVRIVWSLHTLVHQHLSEPL